MKSVVYLLCDVPSGELLCLFVVVVAVATSYRTCLPTTDSSFHRTSNLNSLLIDKPAPWYAEFYVYLLKVVGSRSAA